LKKRLRFLRGTILQPALSEPLPAGMLETLKQVSSGSLTTQLFKRGLRQCFLVGLQPMNLAAARFAGEAFTMRLIPAREDIDTYGTLTSHPNPENLQWEGVDQVRPGQVLVIDARNEVRAGTCGAILAAHMMVKGCAAIVTDGALRDGVDIAQMPFPAYARQTTGTSRLSYHRVADLQVPISCADVAVYPGDILVGDGNGVTVIPRYMAEEVTRDAAEQDRIENYLNLRILAGDRLYGTYPPNAQTRADFEAWTKAGAKPEDALRLRALHV
jgi:regulator of RNase E activity RraA